jgi:hypothetical protein
MSPATPVERLDHALDGAYELDHAQTEAGLSVRWFGCCGVGEGFFTFGELAFQEVFLYQRFFGGGGRSDWQNGCGQEET